MNPPVPPAPDAPLSSHDPETADARALRTALSDLARVTRDLNEFVHIAAHDLKEPFRTISFQTSFVLEDHKDALPAEAVARLENMQRVAQRGMCLVDDLTRFARSGEVHCSREPIPLFNVATNAAAAIGTELADDGVDLKISTDLPAVPCDSAALSTAFSNLIANAARYNTATPKQVRITSRPAAAPGTVEIVVSDNGIGIPANRRTDVFRVFRRLHRDNEFGPGTGIGLAIVKKIIEGHRGTVHVEENPAGGSLLVLTLPATAH